MPTLAESISDAATRLTADAAILHTVVHGADTETATVESGPVKSLAKAIKDLGTASNYGRSISNVTALRALLAGDLLANRVYHLLGYYAPGDGGGGMLYVDIADTTTADNGGSTFVVAGIRIKRVIENGVRVEQFGAKGDGTTFDADAINACITWAAPRRMRVIMTQTYRLNKAIQMIDNTFLDGELTGRVVKAFTGFSGNRSALQNYPLWNVSAAQHAAETDVKTTGIKVHNLHVYNENPATYTVGNIITIWGGKNVELVNCRFGGPGAGCQAEWISSFYCDDMIVDNCHFENDIGVWHDGYHLIGGRRHRLTNSMFIGGDDALAILNVFDNAISDVVVSNCTMRSYNAHCIRIGKDDITLPVSSHVNYVERIRVENCVGVSGWRNGAILIEDVAESGVYTYQTRNITVDGFKCRMDSTYDTLGVTNGYGIAVWGCADVVLRDIVIENANTESQILSAKNVVMDRVRIRNATTRALVISKCDKVRLREVDLSVPVNNQVAIRVIDTEQLYLESCEILNNVSHCLQWTHVSLAGILSVKDSRFMGTGNGLVLTNNPERLIIEGSYFDAALSSEVSYAGGAQPALTQIHGNFGIGDYYRQNPHPIKLKNTMLQLETDDFSVILQGTRTSTSTSFNLSMGSGHFTLDTTSAYYVFNGAQFLCSTLTADATDKAFAYLLRHYTNAEEPVCVWRALSAASATTIIFGSGAAGYNSPTSFEFFAAANNTTTTGTKVASLALSGMRLQPAGVAANARRVLDMIDNTGGFVIPVLTGTQRDAIGSPIAAEILFNSTKNMPNFYTGSAWLALPGTLMSSGAADIPSISAGGAYDFTISVPGAQVADLVIVSNPGFATQLVFTAFVSATDTVTIRCINAGTASFDYGNATYRVLVFKNIS